MHTPKPRSVLLIATLTAAVLTGGAGHAAAVTTATAAATPASTLTVDLGAPTGAFRGGASGALYGLYDQDVPSDNLIRGMGMQTTDTKAQDGQQHPGSDALEVAKPFLASGGRDVMVYMTDVYRNFPYERTSYAQYQGYLKTEVEQILTDPNRDHIVLVPYNEPDANWFGGMNSNRATLDAFDAEWLQTYRYLKGLWPQARIAGPNLTGFYPGTYTTFLTFCKANGCLPDLMTWHELSVPSNIRAHVPAYRALEKQLGIPPLPVNLNEYAARYQLTNPGEMVPWLSALEDTKVDGDLPYWNINGSLGDSAAQQNVPNAQWWLYRWYSAMTGNTVQVTPSRANADDTLQGLATVDTAKRQARVIVGGGPAGQAAVTVKNISPAVFGHTVHATVQQDRWSGMVGAAAQPARLLDADLPVGADGSVTLPIDNGTPPSVTGCNATGSRVAGKLGNAVSLCGNGEYVTLPQGIVSNLNDFTVSAWVNPAQNSTWSRVFDFGSGTGTYMFLTLNSGNNLRFAITTSGGGAGEQQINATGLLPVNTWSHVAVTLSGTTGTLYVNGKVVGTNTAMSLKPSSLGATTQNWIGKSQYNDPYLDGAVDDFQIYSRALAAADVAALASGQPGAGDVASYRFDEASGAAAVDSSGSGHAATIVSAPQLPPATDAYQIILSPGGTGSPTPADATWTHSYEAEDATLTGTGWNINTEGTLTNLGGFATSNNRDVGGLRTGSSTVITFHVDVPSTADYDLAIFEGSFAHAADVSGPTNVFVRVDGGPAQQVYLPAGYEWVIWNHADSTVHLSAGAHDISLSTVGDGGAATNGDAIIDKIDLRRVDPAVQGATVYEAEQADLSGARTDYRRQGQSGAGAVDLDRGQSATFWVYSAADGYSDLVLRGRPSGTVQTTVDDQGVVLLPTGVDRSGWLTQAARVYLRAGINKVVVSGRTGRVVLDKLTAGPATGGRSAVTTYQAESGTLTGTARVDNGYSQANGGVVTGIGNGPANALRLTVHAPAPGRYAMTVRFANDTELNATHYNPDLMTAPADISVNGGPTRHVNFGNTFSWNQFWNLTIPVDLKRGTNTITFIANQQYNYDGTTIGVIYSGSNGVGSPLRSATAPNLDQIALAPLQLPAGLPR